jgi:hypothetical protein
MNKKRFNTDPLTPIKDPIKFERIQRVYSQTKKILTENRFNLNHFLEYCKREATDLEKSDSIGGLTDHEKDLYYLYNNINKNLLEDFIQSNTYTNKYKRVLLAFAEFHKNMQIKKRHMEESRKSN